jgi:hypothetical protein
MPRVEAVAVVEGAPMMAVVPSADNATDHPDRSPVVSPSMSVPCWSQVLVVGFQR